MFLVFAANELIEDYIFEKQLSLFIEKYELDVQSGLIPYLPFNVSVYQEVEQVPLTIRRWITEFSPGIYEMDTPEELDFFYAIIESDFSDNKVFVFDASGLELSDEVEWRVGQLLIFGFAIMLALFFLVFKLVVKRALSPMYKLIDQINQQQLNTNPIIASKIPFDNELGLLNQTLADYSKRIDSFIRREREFTGFASHELRTPVTIIKGALSVLNSHNNFDDKQLKPLKRIERATESMGDMIEMLLSLSREQQMSNIKQKPLPEIIEVVISNFSEHMALNGKKLELELGTENDILLPDIPAEIALSNIVRNAIEHSCGETITMQVDRGCITLTNKVQFEQAHINRQEQGYGLGNLIVSRICEKHHWSYRKSVQQNTFTVTLNFTQPQIAN